MAIMMTKSSSTPSMFTSNLFSFFLLHVLLFSLPMQRCSADDDCLGKSSRIDDIGTNSPILVSSGNNTFELGFFTPDGSTANNRYLGIWYRNYTGVKIVVWVANWGNPLHGFNASLIVGDNSAKLLDRYGVMSWSTDSGPLYRNPSPTSPGFLLRNSQLSPKSSDVIHVGKEKQSSGSANSAKPYRRSNLTELCLSDRGNLIFHPRDALKPWQSFEHPTDTFLPGMFCDGIINLTSWRSRSIPAPGDFTVLLEPTVLTIIKAASAYWETTGAMDELPTKLTDMLQGNIANLGLTRLVINFTGTVQYWKWDSISTSWSLKWFEPKDRCSLYGVCGNFASCNSYNELLCKCLPGFTPSNLTSWNARNFLGGCLPKFPSCEGKLPSDDLFLTLPMMKVGSPNAETNLTAQECKAKCHTDCHCVAYSSDTAALTETGTESNCHMWISTDLTSLQEEYPGGITLHVRSKHSNIALTSRDCDTCGAYSIPYPLSTGAACGDPSYLFFQCNTSTGQVVFSTSSGKFNVTSISQESKSFFIQVPHVSSCDSRTIESIDLLNSRLFPFNMRSCNNIIYQPLMEVNHFIEVEIGWQPPLELICNTSSGCGDWPHTTCKAAKGGKMRCICSSSLKWDGRNLKCIRVFPVKVLIACVAAALAVVSLGGVVFIYWRRKIARETGSVELMGDNSEQIDLPFFDWESILLATNNFADENKLGTGGFGSVYKGNLPDEEKIAVKRLSSVSVQGVEEFRTEVLLIAKLQHRNLVRLLGYCVKADEKILVYEYMPNGSLDACLFDETFSVNLDWKRRFDIITGIARGLMYLHHDSRLRIIHRDLKPSNILLDDDLNPKISDFGIARIVEGKQTESSTLRVVGTYGYMSPEYAHEGIFSVKSDVFSFGVVVLETITGRRNSRIFIYEHGLSLLGHAWKLWNEDKGIEVADRSLRDSCNISEVLKCIQIALLCIQEDPSDRPTMSTVVHMLSSENTSLPPPKQPAFSTRKPHLETTSSSSAVDLSSNDLPFTVSTVGR